MRKKSLIRSRRSHKGDYGHVLVIAGSRTMTGAAYLVGQSAMRAGAGRVTIAVPKGLHAALARRVTETMTLPLPETRGGALDYKSLKPLLDFAAKADAVVLGPGLSTEPSTQRLVRALVLRLRCPLVLDADGLNALKGKAALLKRRKGPVVLTPHEGEFLRLLGRSAQLKPLERKGIAKRFSRHYHCILVLKGADTVVSDPRGLTVVNRTGNPGMASAGMGDVLAGCIGALLGQGFDPFLAAKIAVYAHGKAGDLAAKSKGQTSLIASDVIQCLPRVFKALEKKPNLLE